MGNDNGQKEKLVIHAPAACRGCNTTTDQLQERFGGWLVYPINPGVAIYMCPFCSAVQGNPNAYENEQRMMAIAKRVEAERIIRPNAGPRIIPGFKR